MYLMVLLIIDHVKKINTRFYFFLTWALIVTNEKIIGKSLIYVVYYFK